MNHTRRDLLRTLMGASASLELLSLAGCQRPQPSKEGGKTETDNGFTVICHGMFLFEVGTTAHTLTLYMPDVPAMGADPGHVYEANNYNSFLDAADLGQATPATYSLSGMGPAATMVPSGITNLTNVVLQPGSNCDYSLKPNSGKCKIVMPLPDGYFGWRKVFVKPGYPSVKLFTTHDPCITVPQSIYETHVFYYKSPQNPSLTDTNTLTQKWPRGGTPPGYHLHLVAQPMSYCELVAAYFPKSPPDHTVHLNQMFNTTIDLQPAGFDTLTVFEDTQFFYGLQRSDLVNVDETDANKSKNNCDAASGKLRAFNEQLFTLINGQLTNCRSYFVLRS